MLQGENSGSTLSSVYVTTESHEKRMRVAEQCALRFADSNTLWVISILNLYKSTPSPEFSTFDILGKEGKSKF